MEEYRQYIVYYRVSTKQQGESGLGLEAQQSYIKHFYGNEKIIATYTEIASAKTITQRPVLQQAIHHCIEKNAVLLVAKIDRLSRKTEDALSIFSQLNERLESCDVPHLDKFTLTLYMAIADRERELISLRTRQALAAKKARGEKWQTGNPDFINGKVAQKGRKTIENNRNHNPHISRASAMAKQLKTAGKTLAEIAAELNKHQFNTIRKGKWHATSVYRLLLVKDNE